MSKIASNQSVSTAVGPVSLKSYQQDHVTSQCFMRPMVAFGREKPATRSIKVKSQDFMRLMPLPVPTFGRALVHSRAFFVPYRTVWKDWNGFINQSPVSRGGYNFSVAGNTPYILNGTFLGLLIRYSSVLTNATTVQDFKVENNGTATRYKLNAQGQYILKILEQLGYKVNFNTDDNFHHCALPLLAFMKVILDWYYPSQYAYNIAFSRISSYFERFEADTNPLDIDTIDMFFHDFCYCQYETDYFASAWDNPVSPNSSNFEGQYNIPDITYDGSSYTQGLQVLESANVNNQSISNGTPGSFVKAANNNANLAGSFTKYMHEMLSSMTDYTRRHSIAGVRAVDRYLAEYGISLSAEILRRSIYLGDSQHTIRFGDVFSTADTADAGGDNLGDYAGKGSGFGQGVFTYDDSKEFGFFLIINSIVPQVGFYQGQVKDTMRSGVLDFYHGDYNGKGVEAISMREYFVPYDGTNTNYTNSRHINESVYGFIPRDAYLHCGFDRVTGVFNYGTINNGLNAYFLQRVVNPVQIENTKHDVNAVLATDYQDYNRIFYANDKDVADNIFAIFHFEVEYRDALVPLWDTYDFEKSYKDVKLNVGGTTVN